MPHTVATEGDREQTNANGILASQGVRCCFHGHHLHVIGIPDCARRTKSGATRLQEGKLVLLLRIVGALPLTLMFLAYACNPGWVAWASVPLPDWLRSAAVFAGVLGTFGLWWVFASIGDNISETTLTKPGHELIRHGPYRWIRHPLYAFGLSLDFCLRPDCGKLGRARGQPRGACHLSSNCHTKGRIQSGTDFWTRLCGLSC